jgi:hypothetical protein
MVIAAVHHAANALLRVAAADLDATSAAVRGQRLYVPTRTLPDYNDVLYRYGNATPADTIALLESYQAAADATARATAELDTVALSLNTPSWVLAAARAAAGYHQEDIYIAGGPHRHPTHPAERSSADQDPARPRKRGPVERAVRELITTDPVVLLRALAIDHAIGKLVGETLDSAGQPTELGPAEKRPQGQAANAAVRAAAGNFPAASPGSMARHAAIDPARCVEPDAHPTGNRRSSPQAGNHRRL